jgi:hypothetical protein
MDEINLTKEETEQVYNFISLPFVISVVEKSLRDIKREQQGSTLISLYIKTNEILLKKIRDDLNKTGRIFKKAQIGVTEIKRSDTELKYKVFFRGYEQILVIDRETLKSSVSKRLGYYTRSLIPESC